MTCCMVCGELVNGLDKLCEFCEDISKDLEHESEPGDLNEAD